MAADSRTARPCRASPSHFRAAAGATFRRLQAAFIARPNDEKGTTKGMPTNRRGRRHRLRSLQSGSAAHRRKGRHHRGSRRRLVLAFACPARARVVMAAIARPHMHPSCEVWRVDTPSTYSVLEAAGALGILEVVLRSSVAGEATAAMFHRRDGTQRASGSAASCPA